MRDHRVISNGAEAAFVESWSGWDEVEAFALQFYDPIFTNDFADIVGMKTVDCVVVSYENCYIEGYDFKEDGESEVMFHHKFKLTLV